MRTTPAVTLCGPLHLCSKGGVSESHKQALAHFRRPNGATRRVSRWDVNERVTAFEREGALAWFREAARRNHADGMWLLGQSLLQGSGCEVDFDGAKKWLTEAAQHESYDALHWLGVMHEYGLGLERDTRKARALYETAASNGHAMAEYHLALMHAYGPARNAADLPRA